MSRAGGEWVSSRAAGRGQEGVVERGNVMRCSSMQESGRFIRGRLRVRIPPSQVVGSGISRDGRVVKSAVS